LGAYRGREGFLRRLEMGRIVAVGFGLTGKAVARSLKRLGLQLFLVDTREEEDLKGLLEEVGALGLPIAWGADARDVVAQADLVVVSPGVDLGHEIFSRSKRGAEVISEVELAYRLAPCPIVAVTGTNGKSTTTRLIGAILAQGGKQVLVGGNIGEPLIEKVLDASATTILVAEISSFQLESCRLFRPFVGVILNVASDHLDRHGTYDEYASTKGRLFQRQKRSDVAIANLDDPTAKAITETSAGRKYYFSRRPHQENGTFVEGGRVWWQDGGRRMDICSTDIWALPGAHNEENLLAAVAAARVFRVRKGAIAAALGDFRLSEHTFEEVRVIGGLTYINDSKGTNPAATARALDAISGRVVLIAGGSDKGLDYDELLEAMREKVRCLITLGQTGGALSRIGERAGVEEIRTAADLPEAVRLSGLLGKPGESILFSPAAASFDMFRDYKERGDAFKKAVGGMKK